MSEFKNTINTFSNHYQLKPLHKMKLLGHYPLFKMYWHSNYGKGLKKKIANSIYPLFKSYSINIETFNKERSSVKIPIKFDNYDLASFKEIFWGLEYGEVLKINDIQTVFDIGANTGMASLFFLANLPLNKLVVVEANPGLIPKLHGILNAKNIIIENLAIYGERGSLKFNVSENHRESTICDDQNVSGDNIVAVNTVLLEDLLQKHSLVEADLLKMDIEGAEYNILEKTPESFLKFKYIYIEIHGDKKTRDQFRSKLIELGFELVQIFGDDHPICETSLLKRKM